MGKSIHGHNTRKNRSPEHRSWTMAKCRCFNPSYKGYGNYGGRGISMCRKWQQSFQAFLDDMGPRPKGTSLERINKDGNYEPGNCKWASITEQANNQHNNLVISWNGVTQTASEWARQIGINPHTLRQRIIRSKWSPERALTTAVPKGKEGALIQISKTT